MCAHAYNINNNRLRLRLHGGDVGRLRVNLGLVHDDNNSSNHNTHVHM